MNRITYAKVDDTEAIFKLQKRSYQSEAKRYNDWTIPPLTQSLESLKDEILAGGVLKYSLGQAIVGSVRTSRRGGKCVISRLMVVPEFQRHGIGSALLTAVEAHFPNVQAFELSTESKSVDDIRFYQRQGYQIIAAKVLSPAVTSVFMSKPGRFHKLA